MSDFSDPKLNPQQRAWFGLEEHESIRVLTSGARTILLERVGDVSGAALPWDREVVLVSDVRAFALADLLRLLHESSKSGFLYFEAGDHVKSVYLDRGEVIFATSNQMVDRLGQCLLRAGIITPDQFREARDAFKPGRRFGAYLVEKGYLSAHKLWEGVRIQVEEIVRSLFSYGTGKMMFWEGDVRPDNSARISLATEPLVAEGLKRRDELIKFLAKLEDPRTRLEAMRQPKLTGTERAIFDEVDGRQDFRTICRKAGIDPLSGARTMQLLRQLGAVNIARDEAPPSADAETLVRGDEDAVRDCARLHVKVMAELAAPIVALEGGDGIRERLQTVLNHAARRFPAILAGVQVAHAGLLDPEDICDRALQFPGDREHEVRLAVGELIAYLKFEIANHPRIDDPDDMLEGLEDLG